MRIARTTWRTTRYLAVVCLVLLASLAWTPCAHAAAQYEASVEFTSILSDETGVTLSGTVTNTGTDPLYRAQVVFWRDRTPLTTHDQLDAALAADPESDTGDRILEDDSVTVIVSGRETFDPGQTADFTVVASWDDMSIRADGVYLVGVHVRASASLWGSLVTIGRGRTLVTVAQNDSSSTATVVMLTSAPALLHDNVFVDDHLADDLRTRLSVLLDLAQKPGVSWVVDPALIFEVTQMARGYEVMDIAGTTTPGTGRTQATTWLSLFQTLNRDQGYRLPWGNPDLALGASTGVDLISPSQSKDLPVSELQSLPLVVRAGNGLADDNFLTSIASLQPDIILAQAGSDAVTPQGVLLNSMATPYPGGPGPDADTPLQQRQRAVAEDALSDHNIRVIETESDAALASEPLPGWVTPIPLSSIPATTTWTTDLARGQAAGPLTTQVFVGTDEVHTTIITYASLINDPDAAAAATAIPRALLASQSWSGDEAAASYAATVEQWLRSILSSVSLTATPEVSLTSRTASFPVTVVNKLTVPVYVRVIAQPVPDTSSPANITIPTTDVVTIQPGDKLSPILSPTVIREGDVDVILTLTTQDGYELNSSASVLIHASESSWMGWVVVGAAAILFIVGTFLRVRSKSRATRSPTHPGDGSAPGEQGASDE